MKLTDKDILMHYPHTYRLLNSLRNSCDFVATDDNILAMRSSGETNERGRKWILTHWKKQFMKTTLHALLRTNLMSMRMYIWLLKDPVGNFKLVLDMTRALVRDPNAYMTLTQIQELERKLVNN